MCLIICQVLDTGDKMTDVIVHDVIGTLLRSIDGHSNASCHHYTIDYNVPVHPPLVDVEKVIFII